MKDLSSLKIQLEKGLDRLDPWLRWGLVVLVLAVGMYRIWSFLFVHPSRLAHPFFLYDFKIFFSSAANIYWPAEIYNPLARHPYKYSPLLLIILHPLTQLSLPTAAGIYTAGMVFATGAMIYLGGVLFRRRAMALCFLITFAFLYDFWRISLRLGQVQSLWFLGILASLWLSEKGRDRLGGICLGLAIWLKVIPLLFLFYYGARKRGKLIIYTFVGIGGAMVFQILALGWSLNMELMTHWLHLLFVQIQSPGLEALHFKNHSLIKVIAAPLSPYPYTYGGWEFKVAYLPWPVARSMAYLASLSLLGASTYGAFYIVSSDNRERSRRLTLAQFFLLLLLLPPLVWHDYYYLLWLPLGVALWENGAHRPRSLLPWILLGLFGILFLILPKIFHHYRMSRLYWFMGGETWGLVALWGNLLYHQGRVEKIAGE